MAKTILFSHGKKSGPFGVKITELSKIATAKGYKVFSMDYRKCTTEEGRIVLLKTKIETLKTNDIILVGSSMGAYISAFIAEIYPIRALFLMNAAFYLKGYEKQEFKPKCTNIVLVAGWDDEVVPWEKSIVFAKRHGAKLHMLKDNHRLENKLKDVMALFTLFLENN